MRRFAPMLCLMSVGAALAPAQASERSAALVNSFQSFCTPGPPDFAALDAKATAMNLPVRRDVAAPQSGQKTRAKSWVISLQSGSHELVASEARGPNGDAASCGIGAEDIAGEDVRQDLIKALQLGAPTRQTVSADGTQRLTVWKYGDSASLFLADATPMSLPGFYLTLMHQATTNR